MVYSDVVRQNLILPKKEKYTLKDFARLVKAGVIPKEARFICICSAVYHSVEYSKAFHSKKIRAYCGIL